jgi:long-subunit acyl-CoA synthetase (AMP-forming)
VTTTCLRTAWRSRTESIDTVPVNIGEIKPSMMSVPRLYEKIYARVVENAVAAVSRRTSFWARCRRTLVG